VTSATVRYFVLDLDPAVAFYRDLLGFEVELQPSPNFAMLYRGELRLLLSVPGGSSGGGAPLADGTRPAPGGWNRFAIQVGDLGEAVNDLTSRGGTFLGDIIVGVGVKQALLRDPDGNLIELYEPLAAYHERSA
jgi:catechol 2,3-dioxygenase-like lactoylglutathione lyase family enzyme